ncbi:MAG: T9SS type A sorting domain-containing protein [Flavobacteriaceae bacterium]|nr:T9SS type A sorting domain-containing protein [Flavobacteriaceae bacterium]
MKKTLLYLLLLLPFLNVAQTNVYNYGFNSPTATMTTTDGWSQTNQSEPVGASTFSVPTAAVTAFATGAQSGAALSYVLVNYNSTTGAGDISNWLISPVINIQNGDIITFYTRTVTPNANPTPTNTFPDRLELRLSPNGAFTTNPSTGATSLGDFTTLCVSVNPNLLLTGAGSYPGVWTQYSYVVSGLTGPTDCLAAFRYWVTDGGPTGTNSNIIAIDTFSVDRPAANTQNFFAGNFSMQPNPVTDVFNITAKNGVSIEKVDVLDINGRVVNQVNASSTEAVQINISNLNSGVYFVKVQSDLGVGTSKIIKK